VTFLGHFQNLCQFLWALGYSPDSTIVMKKRAFNGVILIKQQKNYNIIGVNIFK